MDDLPLVDLNKLDLPVSPKALNVMEVSGLKRASGKGLILKLMIPEEPFLQFTKSNDGTPGVLISVLMARAIERVHPHHDEPLISSYVVNARPMLGANDSFHNCASRVVFHYDDKIRRFALDRQCTIYRGKVYERTSGYLRLAIRPRSLSIAKIRYPSTTKATTIAPMKSATPSTPEMAGSRKV